MTERRHVYQDRDGVRRTLIWDDSHRSEVTVRTEQDVEQILDGIARDRELMRHDGVNKLVARIPVAVYERACLDQWDEGDWKRWLNSAEAAPFRVWQGQV
jgi:hypothetical protein